jgi:hypothetical protein
MVSTFLARGAFEPVLGSSAISIAQASIDEIESVIGFPGNEGFEPGLAETIAKSAAFRSHRDNRLVQA